MEQEQDSQKQNKLHLIDLKELSGGKKYSEMSPEERDKLLEHTLQILQPTQEELTLHQMDSQ